MSCDVLSAAEVLGLLPQQRPFRFVDEISEIDEEHIVAAYRYRPDEYFYQGHFPGNPVTPGVILIETIAQAGVAALGIYLRAQSVPRTQITRVTTLFTEAEAEFHAVVAPGTRVTVRAHKVFFRHGKLRVKATLCTEDGQLACSGIFSGMGVSQPT